MPEPTAVATALSVAGKAKDAKDIVEIIFNLRNAHEYYRQEQERNWWQQIVDRYPGKSPEEVASEVESRFHNVESRERAIKAVWQSYRTLMESVDDRVLPPLATLTADYLAHDRRPDAFYRGVCRTLGDLNFEEYESLKVLVTTALEKLRGRANSDAVNKIKWWYDESKSALRLTCIYSDKVEDEYVATIKNYDRIMHLLAAHGLTDSPSTWGGPSFLMSTNTLIHLGAVLT